MSALAIHTCLCSLKAINDLSQHIEEKQKLLEDLKAVNSRLVRRERMLKLQAINLSLAIESKSVEKSHTEKNLIPLLQVGVTRLVWIRN